MARTKVGAALTKSRPKTHGSFDEVASTAGRFNAILVTTPNWHSMNVSQKMALQEIVHKLARISVGDPNHADHWADIAGYGELGYNACADAQNEAAKAARKRARKVKVKPNVKRVVKKAVKKAVKKTAKKSRPRQPVARVRTGPAVEAPAARPPRPRRQRTRNRHVEPASPAQSAAE